MIGNAIGDCVAGQNEFNGKTDEDYITFAENTKPEIYSQANCNAVILYNYIHEALNNNSLSDDPDAYEEEIGTVETLLEKKTKDDIQLLR